MNVEHIQTVIEVVAKLTSGHGLLWHLVGCGQDANVHCSLHFAAQAA